MTAERKKKITQNKSKIGNNYPKGMRLPWRQKIIYCTVALIVIVLATIVVILTKRPEEKPIQNDNLQTYTLTGTVTSKSDPAIADAGDYVKVDGRFVTTASGGPLPRGVRGFHVDTRLIYPGDKVEVRYIEDSEGRASLNCSSCYIRKVE